MASKTTYILAGGVAVVIAAGVAVAVLHKPSPTVPSPASAPAGESATTAPGSVQAPTASPVAPGADPCLLPGPPPVAPSGATATADDMKLGHDVIQHFVEQLEGYQACRNNQIDHAPAGVSADQKEKWTEQGNAAVDEAHAVADSFTAQLQVFKQRHPDK
jgi:hypothetical protein